MSEVGFVKAESLGEMNRRLAGAMNDWELAAACPACLATKIGVFDTLGGIAFSRCRACGLAFANPRPSDEVIGDFYNSDFYNNYRALEANRRQSHPYFSLSAYTDQRELAKWLLTTKPRSVLDFGAGPGAFLALLRDEFGVADVDGLELNNTSIAVARESYHLDIVSDRGKLRHASYDAVLLLEVIEHIIDIDAVMGDVATLVRPGGHLLLTTPSVEGFVARHLPGQCLHYTAPSHVSLFTEKAMRAMLDRFGFDVAALRTDPAGGTVTAALRSLFYRLDFRSPAHSDDTNDAWWEPTALGRRLRRPAGRVPALPKVIGFPAEVTDWLVRRAATAIGRGRPDHLYVLARRRGTAPDDLPGAAADDAPGDAPESA